MLLSASARPKGSDVSLLPRFRYGKSPGFRALEQKLVRILQQLLKYLLTIILVAIGHSSNGSPTATKRCPMASTGIEDSSKTRSIIERLVCEKVLPELVTRAHANDTASDASNGDSQGASLSRSASFQVADPAPIRLGVLDQLRIKYEHLTGLTSSRRPAMQPSFWWQSDWPKTSRRPSAPPPGAERCQHLPYASHQRSTAS